METKPHIEVVAVQDFYLAAALISYGYRPQTSAKTKNGAMQYTFVMTDEVREYIKQFDSDALLVPMSYPEAVDSLMDEPFYWH